MWRPRGVFWQRGDAGIADLYPSSTKTRRRTPPTYRIFCSTYKDERNVSAAVKLRLMTVHPNPGPRDKTEEGKKRRRERRYERRRDKRKEAAENLIKKRGYINIVTWNMQRMSVGTRNNRKLKSVAKYVEKNNFDVVLLSEISAKDRGVIWLGENSNLTAVIYSEKAAIMIRGYMLHKWCEGGQKIKADKRTISIKIDEMTLTSTYMPVYLGNNSEELETEKEILKNHAQWANKNEKLVIGGDFNAHIGGGEDRPGVCGIFGLRQSNHQGRELMDWLEENNLCYVNSYFKHKKRGTWYNNALGRWYELDGFLMRSQDRHKHVQRINTIGEASLSDHLPKKMRYKLVKTKIYSREKPKKTPRIIWEKLRQDNIAEAYKTRIEELMDNTVNNDDSPEKTDWNEISDILLKAAEEICGVEEKEVENPWMVGRDEEVTEMRARITAAVTGRNEANTRLVDVDDDERDEALAELTAAREELKEARKELKRKSREWELQWWDEIIKDCKDADERNDSGVMYKNLRKLGKRGLTKGPQTSTITKEQFKEHFQKISKDRFENTPEEIEEIVNQMEDVSMDELAEQCRDFLETSPTNEEIRIQMKEMRESAPGEDGVRLIYIQKAGPRMQAKVMKMVRFMFENGADNWEESLKSGLVIPLHKKGDRNNENNYRGVCLLAMGSRILARVLATRLRVWSEKMSLLDDDQAGFRSKRSTADITQIFYRIQEDSKDLFKRAEKAGIQLQEGDKPAARLLDLRKAYPRVNKPALWRILSKYGMGEKCLRAVKDLHETTRYKIKSREGCSEAWTPNRGLREGCPTSPPLFNIFHQVVMRLASKARKRKADEMDNEVGISIKWVPGSSFPSSGLWEKHNSEAKRVRIDRGLFADDTTIAGRKRELPTGVNETKVVMGKFEERNNEDKEEYLDFGTEESNNIRMLGVWLGETEDVKQRLKRAGAAWVKIRNQLKGSRLSKSRQAKIVESCVESTLLFDCAVRTWRQGEIKKLQQCMDRKYRTIWSRRTGPPLIQMQQEHKNMWDVRRELGVKSVRYKIEKRVLERVGHIMRMEDDRTVKAAVLGWLEDLEPLEKLPGKKRKTMLYWKQLLREASIDHTNIAQLTKERDEWKALVRTRMKHVEEWEMAGGHGVDRERGPRESPTPDDQDEFVCDFEDCGRRFFNKAGLTTHRRRMHEVSKQKVKFQCERCRATFAQEANLKNHRKTCSGHEASDPTMKKCGRCGKEIRKSNFSRHAKVCGGPQAQAPQQVQEEARVYVAQTYVCPGCGTEQAVTNRGRHHRICRGGP